MTKANDFMKDAARTHDPSAHPPEIQSDRPTAARCYDFTLGGKDNFAVDREFCVEGFKAFPESLDIAHENQWRPDPDQQPIEVDASPHPFLGASKKQKAIYEYGAVLRKP